MSVKILLNNIVRRAKLELEHGLTRNLSINQRYRPAGVKPVIRQTTIDVEYFEVHPPHLSKIDLLQEFIDDCSPYLKPVTSIQSQGDYILTLRHGRIYTSDESNFAVITNDNYVLDEVSFQCPGDELLPVKFNAIFSSKGFVQPIVYKGRVFSLLSGGGAKEYFYHWIYETLPKLHLLKQSGRMDDVDHFIVPATVYKFQRAYLAHYGISEDKIISADDVHHIQADLLMVTSHIKQKDHHSRWVCDFLYRSMIGKGALPAEGKRIYIARGDAKSRHVHNEALLIQLLEDEFGFETHYLTRLTIEEQAQLFNAASFIVSPHSGGLSNLAYCRPGTIILEIFADQFVRHIFYDIANKARLDYDYLIFASDGTAENSLEGQAIGLKVDVDTIRRRIISLLRLPEGSLV